MIFFFQRVTFWSFLVKYFNFAIRIYFHLNFALDNFENIDKNNFNTKAF